VSRSGQRLRNTPPPRFEENAAPTPKRRPAGGKTAEKTSFPKPNYDYPYFVTVVPGLEAIAEEEIRDLDRKAEFGKALPGLVPFDTRLSPEDLLGLRCVEDVFAALAIVFPLKTDSTGILQTFRAAHRSPLWDAAIDALRSTRPPKKRRLTYRVVAQLDGHHAFRRLDLQRAVEDAVAQKAGIAWERVPEDAAIEVWVRGEGNRAAVGIRLSDNTMRHRTYKEVQLPASLKPTVAAAMVRLTRPADDDTFLDPMCGSGTILLERALAGRHGLILGGDNDPNALDAAKANVGRRHQPLRIEPMDVRHLPLEAASIDKLATNLPFGRQILTPAALPELYEAAFHEFARVVKPGGRAVLLAAFEGFWKEILPSMPQWDLKRQYRIDLLGARPSILVLNRTDAPTAPRRRKRK
jgi:23S rRNA G2445 N2-methylase RlmL